MDANLGKMDKFIRYLLGSAILLVGIFYDSWWGVMGVYPIFTASISWCPFYWKAGLSSNNNAKETGPFDKDYTRE